MIREEITEILMVWVSFSWYSIEYSIGGLGPALHFDSPGRAQISFFFAKKSCCQKMFKNRLKYHFSQSAGTGTIPPPLWPPPHNDPYEFTYRNQRFLNSFHPDSVISWKKQSPDKPLRMPHANWGIWKVEDQGYNIIWKLRKLKFGTAPPCPAPLDP